MQIYQSVGFGCAIYCKKLSWKSDKGHGGRDKDKEESWKK